MSSISVRDILGDYNTALWVWPTSWKGNGMVNPNTFLYFPALVASIALGIALLVAIINLAKRVFEIVFLYLVMPLSMSTLAADDGARFKIWRETFITKIVLAYGAVFSINIFVLILPMLSQMRIDGISDFGNAMFLIFMIVGGAMVIPAGMNLFARLFGQADDIHGGGSFLRSAYYGSRFASLAVFGLAGGLLKMGYKGTRGVVRKIRAKKLPITATMIRVARQTEGTDIRKRRLQRRKVEQKQVQIQEEAANRVNNRNTLSVEERVRGSLFGFKKFQKFFRMIDGNR